ncbi:MAG: LPS assembly protein LptD [Methylococcaceae bacterium]
MHRRLILISYLSLQLDSVSADSTTAWDCEQSKNSNQWDCNSSAGHTAPEPAPSIEKIITETLSPPNSVVTPAPLPVKPAAELAPVTTPIATPIAAQQVISKPTETPPSKQACMESAEDCAQQAMSTSKAQDSVQKKSNGFQLLDPAFDQAQEKIFGDLHDHLKADPWAVCDSRSKIKNPYDAIIGNPALRETAPMDVDASYSEIFDKVVTSFSGNVNIKRADQTVIANKVDYNSLSEAMYAQGNVYYSEDEISMFSNSVLLNLGTNEARLRDTLFISPRSAVRGSAKVVYQEDKFFSHYKDVAYTSCAPGNQDWIIHASRFKMNKDTGVAAAKNAWLEFKGVPLFYTPYISFPLDNRRKSGFLNPHYSLSGQNGIDVTVPFYWNIAPDYDATFRVRYLDKRGMLLGTDLRYINHMSSNQLSVDILPSDAKGQDPNSIDQTRYQASFKNRTLLSPHLNADINLNYVSDKQYISQLGNALSFSDIRHVRSVADLNYQREGVNFLTRMENFQTIDQSFTSKSYLNPYRKLPQVMLNLNHSFKNMPLTVGLDNEFVMFQHNTNVDGQRIAIKPMISAPLKTEAGFASPNLSLLHTDYLLNNQFSGKDSAISRDLPIASFDAGLFAESNLSVAGTNLTHTLEPRLFYLYVPKSKQDDIPIFDTTPYDTNFDSLFRENRFSGIDRIQNANQLTVALTSRFVDADTGRERLKFSVGDIVYFQDRQQQKMLIQNPTLSTPATTYSSLTKDNETNQFSNIITEMSGQLTDEVSFSSGLQWDPYGSTIARKQIDLHYKNKWGQLFNIGYHQRNTPTFASFLNYPTTDTSLTSFSDNDVIRQGDVSFRLPLFDNWHAVGRWQYSFLYNRTAESFLGLEKENCCWRFRIIGRHYINGLTLLSTQNGIQPTANGDSQTTVMFQIELKSLSSFGDNVDAFLKKSIFGYSDL